MIELRIKQIDPDARFALLEAPDGFVFQVHDPLPNNLKVGDSLSIDEQLWQQWQNMWDEGPPISDWVEMSDLKKHRFDNKVWIPLYANDIVKTSGDVGYEGFAEEYFGCRSLFVPQKNQQQSLVLGWASLDPRAGHKPWVNNDDQGFRSSLATEFEEFIGSNPVLLQHIEVERTDYVYLNPDLILALNLKMEGDTWVCPEEDYVEVIKLKRAEDGKPVRVEIRAEFLKDFLCATNSGLILLTYQSRQAFAQRFSDLNWKVDDEREEKTDTYNWSGRVLSRHEGSFPFNQAFRVLHAGRTDTDFTEDIPVYGFPTDNTSFSNAFTYEPGGKKILQAISEIYTKEWITPASRSPRVRGDEVPSKIEFIVDNNGNTETSETLSDDSRWLWFHPDVITDLLEKKTGILSWYTADTGHVGGAWNRSVHFGVNSIGLINVYAKDIAEMPETDKKTWAKHNVSPEGGVSTELLMSQMQAQPASTIAPESRFFELSSEIQNISKAKLGGELFKPHPSEQAISRKIHRFQTTTIEEFYLLCKEITRYLIERIDVDVLKAVKSEKDGSLGSIKRLERLLTSLGYDGRAIMGVIVGVYELRLADAHLPSSEIENSMKLAGINFDEMKLNSGRKLIENLNLSLEQIMNALNKGDLSKLK